MSKSIFVIVGLIVALIGVIYAMQYTQSSKFRTGLEVLFGSGEQGRPWNWCPENAEKMDFESMGIGRPRIELAEVCNVTVEPVPADKLNRMLLPYLTVSSKTISKTLEADAALEVFQVEGMLFQSRKLSRTLQK